MFTIAQWRWSAYCDILHGTYVKTQEIHAKFGWVVMFLTAGNYSLYVILYWL